MSGFSIDSGGAISVDPEDLRAAAGRMDGLTALYDVARASLERALGIVMDDPELAAQVDEGAVLATIAQADALRDECTEAVRGTLLMADVYEYVELQAAAEAGTIADAAYADSLQLRMDQLAASDERIPQMAAMLIEAWRRERFEGLDQQPTWGGLLAPFFSSAALIGAHGGFGKVLPGMTLSGTADAVKVTAVATSTPAAPPSGFADAFRGFAKAPEAQIKVEKYTFADGPPKYVVYLKGTQSPGVGGTEPWDMKSNAELYTGKTSASYQATLDALAAAGVQPGDEVNIVAHSQSGMIAAHLAMESEYDVKMQITAGSPTEPTLGEDQTLVQLGFRDDIVHALAGGGSPGGTGSPDSIRVTAVDEPPAPLAPVEEVLSEPWNPHMTESYVEMAEQLDASGDPRVEAMDAFWAGLAEAETIESTEYHAERTDPPPSGDPHAYIDRLAR